MKYYVVYILIETGGYTGAQPYVLSVEDKTDDDVKTLAERLKPVLMRELDKKYRPTNIIVESIIEANAPTWPSKVVVLE